MTSPQHPDRPNQQANAPAEQTSVITRPATPPQEAGPAGGPEERTEQHQQPERAGGAAGGPGQDGSPYQAPPAEQFTHASAGPPPWQRVPTPSQPPQKPAAGGMGGGAPMAGGGMGVGGLGEQTTTFAPAPTPPGFGGAEGPPMFGGGPTVDPLPSRETVNLSAAPSRPTAAAPSARRTGRGPRRAALQIKRVDPWSVLKLALVRAVALFFVWLVAVGVLYGVLDGMDVWDKINTGYKELVQDGGQEKFISAGRVFGIAAIVGAVNIVLFTALATVKAFIYNVAADLAGGVEVTLSERE